MLSSLHHPTTPVSSLVVGLGSWYLAPRPPLPSPSISPRRRIHPTRRGERAEVRLRPSPGLGAAVVQQAELQVGQRVRLRSFVHPVPVADARMTSEDLFAPKTGSPSPVPKGHAFAATASSGNSREFGFSPRSPAVTVRRMDGLRSQPHPLPLPPPSSPARSPLRPGSVVVRSPLHPASGACSLLHPASGAACSPLAPSHSFCPPLPASLSSCLPPPASPTTCSQSHSQWKKGKLLGSGTFGQVYVGFNSESWQFCAIKEVQGVMDDPHSKERLKRLNQEIDMLRRFSHPNIVQYHGSELSDKALSIYLEYVSGGSVHKLLREYGPFKEPVVRNYTKQILAGLAYLHGRNTVHRDIKGANILVGPNGEVKLADFGMAKHISSFAEIRSFKGSPYWMAPELIMNSKGYSLSVDIWSLGCTIIEMATARPPWHQYEGVAAIFKIANSKDIPEIPDSFTEEGKSFLQLCLKRNPASRASAVQLMDHPFVQDPPAARTAKSSSLRNTLSSPADGRHTMGLVSRVKSLTVQQGTSMTQGNANSEVVRTSQGLHTETVHQDSRYMELNILERIVNGSEQPSPLDLALLQSITENFSEKKKIGSGGCGIVYKGILRNGVVAVKRLLNIRTIKDKMFHREVTSLISIKHQNIVRFLGYCSFTEEHAILSGGRTIMADIRERLLCFEYIRNGSLEKHITDELRGLEWQTRYQIIIGICRGLYYLHKDKSIIHMDLKPGNILLDDLMVPKITDFGLSRPDSNSQATTTLLISQGYVAPEYISGGEATRKSDIYSLGVIIIELVSGNRTKLNITKVLRRWNHRWIKSMKQSSLGYQQVAKCLEVALRCTQDVPTDRPDISDIIDEIDTTDSQTQVQIWPCCLEDILGIEPLEILIPFEDFKVPHSIELTNDTDDYIAFATKAKIERFCTEPDRGIVPPRSKCSVTLAMEAQFSSRPNVHYTEVITVLSTRVDDGAVATMDVVTAGDIFFDSEEGKVVDEMNVMVVLGTPELSEEEES